VGRAVLAVGAVVWGLAAAAAALVAALGVDRLLAVLPPLLIDADAVRGAAVAMSVALGAAATAHLAVLVALNRRVRLGWTAGLLLSALGTAVCVALAGTAFASAAAEAELALPLAAAGAASLAACVGYAAATAWFVAEIRAGSPSRGPS
jgi:hypothetical protein